MEPSVWALTNNNTEEDGLREGHNGSEKSLRNFSLSFFFLKRATHVANF